MMKPIQVRNLLLTLSLCLLCSACQLLPGGEESKDSGVLLAEAYQHRLFFSDVAEFFEQDINREDSLQLLRSLTESWAREKILLHEAEKNISQSMDIDRLLDDYRTSLLNNYYEQILVETLLDTIVSPRDMEEYYRDFGDQFLLTEAILQCQLIIVKEPTPRRAILRNWWRENSPSTIDSMVNYCNFHAEEFILNADKWYRLSTILEMMPVEVVDRENIQSRDQREFARNDQRYFFRILEWKDKESQAPLSFVANDIKLSILHNRKNDLINRTKKDLYERALDNGKVKINL